MALVPNARGLAALRRSGMPASGMREVNWVLSVTESHNRANVNRSVEESLNDFAAAWQGVGADRPLLRLSLSTCFDCPWEGRVPEAAVARAWSG